MKFVALCSSLCGSVLVPPALAAIPSISEYSDVQYKAKTPSIPSTPSTDGKLASADGLVLVQSALGRASKLVENQSFEAIRLLLREPLFTDFLGYTPGVRGNAGNLKPPPALIAAGASPESLQELLLSLKRLDEFCLSNRVMIFNVEDLEQVNALKATSGRDGSPSGTVDLDEARAFLTDATELLDEVKRSIRR